MRLPAHSTNAYCDGTIIYNDPVVSGVFFLISPQNIHFWEGAAPEPPLTSRHWLYDTMLNFVENLLENERGPMNDQDLTKTDYDPDRSLVLIEGLSHFLTNFLQNLASCQTSLTKFMAT
jgi:hypothetical protein